MPSIIRNQIRANEKELLEGKRYGKQVRQRTSMILHDGKSNGVAISIEGKLYDLTRSAVSACNSVDNYERGQGMLMALQSSIVRAAAHGEPQEASQHAVLALGVFAQGLDGDFSHGVWPDRNKQAGHEKTDSRMARAYLLLLVQMIKKFGPLSQDEAIEKTTEQLDEAIKLATDEHVRVWTVLSYETRRASSAKLGVKRRTDKERLSDLHSKIKRWLAQNERAVPADSMGGKVLTSISAAIEHWESISQQFYDAFFNQTVAQLLRSSPEAQVAMNRCREADDASRAHDPTPKVQEGFATRHELPSTDMNGPREVHR